MDTVAADEQIGRDTANGRPRRAVDELAPHPAGRVLPEAGELVAGMDARRAETIHYRPMQDAEQLATMDRNLGPAVAHGHPEWLAPDLLATTREVDVLGGGDADGGEGGEQPQLGQLAHRMREEVDPHAQLTDGRGGLVDAHILDACRMER